MEFTTNFGAINLLVVFGATIAGNLLGGIWYSPFLFGKLWRKFAGLGPSSGSMNNPAGTFVTGFILLLIAASMLAALLGPNSSMAEGMRLGTLIGVAFVFTTIGITNLFENRPVTLILIHSGYHIVSLGMMGAMIGAWG